VASVFLKGAIRAHKNEEAERGGEHRSSGRKITLCKGKEKKSLQPTIRKFQ